MISLIVEAAENFLQHQIELSTQKVDTLSQMRTVLASIEVEMDDGETRTVYIGFNEPLIKEIVSVYLMEDDPDEDTMRDMALESTNMIVGSAKVLAEESESAHFNISTPVFHAIKEFDTSECRELSIIKTDKASLLIGIKA